MPVDPPPSRWSFPSPLEGDPEGPVAVGGDLEPATLIEAYRSGLFPMPLSAVGDIGWFSPDPRAVLPLGGLKAPRSLRRSVSRMDASVDRAFVDVVRACGDPARPHGWINEDIVQAYAKLHELGWAHSVETWSGGELVGGLYGVAIGSLFAGESMFHHATDASKVALVHLVECMRDIPDALLDVQWSTPHLQSLGVVEIPRSEYLSTLARAVQHPALSMK